MKMIGRTVLPAGLLLSALPAVAQAPMGPAQAIAAAAAAPGGEVTGTFDMTVGSTGASGFQVYLNSAKDYHDPANLTVELDPGPRANLKQRLGGEPEDLMTGKHVRVTGTARRIAIPHRDGTPPDYQTRIRVEKTSQITTVD